MNRPSLKKHVNQPSLKINSKSSPGQALTGEASKVVNTLAELATIVVLGLTALVEVLDSRDRVERTGDVEVPVPNVVRTCLDNFDQLPFGFLLGLLFVVCFYLYNLDELSLDVPLDDLRLGVRVLLHLDGGVHRHRPVHLVELVHFAVDEDGREGGQGHRRVDL